MKEGWKYVSIGELCDKKNGLWKGKTKPFVNVGVIRNANFTKEFTLNFENIEYLDVEEKQYKTRKLEKGDLIVEKSGGSEKQPVGRTVLFDKEEGEYSFSNFTSVIRIKDKNIITPEFLYKYILHVYLRGDMRAMQKATTGIHNIEFDKYLAIQVPLLSLSEQQSIVTYLDTSFSLIDSLAENAKKALENAKALFQAELKKLMEKKEGWEEKKLEEVVDKGSCISYGIVQPGNGVNEGVPVVRPVDLTIKILQDVKNMKKTTHEISKSYSRTILNGKEILMCVRGTTGVVSLTSSSLVGCNVTRGIVPLKICDDTLRSFVFYAIKAPMASEFIQHFTKGTALKQINIADVKRIPLCIPDCHEQHRIVQTLDTLSQYISQLEQNYNKTLDNCQALKQALLRETFE